MGIGANEPEMVRAALFLAQRQSPDGVFEDPFIYSWSGRVLNWVMFIFFKYAVGRNPTRLGWWTFL